MYIVTKKNNSMHKGPFSKVSISSASQEILWNSNLIAVFKTDRTNSIYYKNEVINVAQGNITSLFLEHTTTNYRVKEYRLL